MFENPSGGVCEVSNREGYCYNCNALIEVSSEELFNLQFICPECGAENRIKPISRKTSTPVIVPNNERDAVCSNCNLEVEISEEERLAGKFICPECGAENNIAGKYEDWKKWLPAIPISLAIIFLYFFGKIGDVITYNNSLKEYVNTYDSLYINIVVFIRAAALVFLIYALYIYFRKKDFLRTAFNMCMVFSIIAMALSTFFIYYTVYLQYNTSSILTTSSIDWDSLDEIVSLMGEKKLFTIKETILSEIFLFVYWAAVNNFFSKINKNNV
ncbi:MAG: hypothetical protein K1X86_09745 [Ignavibacteria bacterium]|nr:hypothetical protein [Ignavibacteria bacterium]